MKNFAAALIAVVVDAGLLRNTHYSTVCIGLKQKRDESLSGGNWSKYAYYATYHADQCLIDQYAGQDICSPIHADANQAISKNRYSSYSEDMAVFNMIGCQTLIEDDTIYAPRDAPLMVTAPYVPEFDLTACGTV